MIVMMSWETCLAVLCFDTCTAVTILRLKPVLELRVKDCKDRSQRPVWQARTLLRLNSCSECWDQDSRKNWLEFVKASWLRSVVNIAASFRSFQELLIKIHVLLAAWVQLCPPGWIQCLCTTVVESSEASDSPTKLQVPHAALIYSLDFNALFDEHKTERHGNLSMPKGLYKRPSIGLRLLRNLEISLLHCSCLGVPHNSARGPKPKVGTAFKTNLNRMNRIE